MEHKNGKYSTYLCPCARTNCYDGSLQNFLLSFLWNYDAASGFGKGLSSFNEDAVEHRNESFQSVGLQVLRIQNK